MNDSEPDWIGGACTPLWTADPGPDRRHAAQELGARAARESTSLRDLATAIMQSAREWWDDAPLGETVAAEHGHARSLISVAGDVVGDAIDGYHRQARTELSRADNDRVDFVNDLLTGRADPGRLAERAHRYGIRLSGTHIVTIARADGPVRDLINSIDSALAQRYGAGNTLTAEYEELLVCISTGGLRGVPAEVAHHLLARLPAGTWQIGVGRAHPGAAGVVASLDEARNVLHLANRLGLTSPVLHAADLLVFPVLLRDHEAITDLVHTVLGPLSGARGGPEPFLETLLVLFEHQGNYAATARTLHLSVRAVTYRLDRIRAMTGYHPGEPTQRFTLHAAALGAKLIGWPTNPGGPDAASPR